MSKNIIKSIQENALQINKLKSIISFFTERELAACFEATMPSPNTPPNEIWNKLERTLSRDFGTLASILSGTEEHFLLQKLLSTLSESKRLLFAEVCDAFWNGSDSDKETLNDYLWKTCIQSDKDHISSIQKQLGELKIKTVAFDHELYDEVEFMKSGTLFTINHYTPENKNRYEALFSLIDYIGCNVLDVYICNHLNPDQTTYEKIVIETDMFPQAFKKMSDGTLLEA
ncbi:MAG: hypothetical protein OQK09_14725 [Colwellia sp.]|nr:hypothetical protein [Colwellia sp.]MCW9082762.1 hypothetical protein [Colwellia sp.]